MLLTIQYEALQLVCFKCGIFGHATDHCPSSLPTNGSVPASKPSSSVAAGQTDVSMQGAESIPEAAQTDVAFSAKNLVHSSFQRWSPATANANASHAVDIQSSQQWQPVQPRRLRRQVSGPLPTSGSAVIGRSTTRFAVLSQDPELDQLPVSRASKPRKARSSPTNTPPVQARHSASQRKLPTIRQGTHKVTKNIEQSKDNMATSSSTVMSDAFPIPSVFAINAANAPSAALIVSGQSQPLVTSPMDVSSNFQQDASDIVGLEAQVTTAPPSNQPAVKPASSSAKDSVISSTTSGPRIQTNIPNFSLPASFSFNVAQDLPKAVLESRPPKPPDPPKR